MVLAARPRAPDGPFHVGLKLDATLLEGFYGSAFCRGEGGLRGGPRKGGLHAGRCLRDRRRESKLHTRSRLRGEAKRHPEENGDYRDNEARAAPLSDSFPRAHVIPFPLVVLALFYYWKERSAHVSCLATTRDNKTAPSDAQPKDELCIIFFHS